jgi:hypothetical protein
LLIHIYDNCFDIGARKTHDIGPTTGRFAVTHWALLGALEQT